MEAIFFISAIIAVAATVMVITRHNAIHALLYLIISYFAVALIFYALGAPFVAALEVIIYAGAIMVLFLFVVMMLNLGPQAVAEEKTWFKPAMLIGPGILSFILLGELFYAMSGLGGTIVSASVSPSDVGFTLYSPYILGVELASLLLLEGLVGAYHLARRQLPIVGEGKG